MRGWRDDASTPGTEPISLAARATAGEPGGAGTRASTPGADSTPVTRWMAACSRADGEDGAWKLLLAFSRPVAGPPNTPKAMNRTSADVASARGRRDERRATDAYIAGSW